MKRGTVAFLFLSIIFGLLVVNNFLTPKKVVEVTTEVTRIVEVGVVETVVETREVEVTRVVEVPGTPIPSEAELAAEKFAEDTGLGEQAFDILAGTHPTLTFLLVEGGLPTPETVTTPNDGDSPAGAQAYCTPNGGWGEWIMRFEDLDTATIGYMTKPGLEGWIFLYGEFTRQNSTETTVGSAWVFGPYIYESYGLSWTPELVADPVAIDTVGNIPGCELAVSYQNFGDWEDAINFWESVPDAGILECETRSRYLVGADTYVSVVCTSEAQTPVSFQFQNVAPNEINTILTGATYTHELVWIFSPDGIGVATGRMLAFIETGRLKVQFPDLAPYEYWVSRDE